MNFLRQKKVLIPLVVIALFHIINFFYYYVGKNDIEGYWHADVENANMVEFYYLGIYQLDQAVEHKGKEYSFIILGREKFEQTNFNPFFQLNVATEPTILGFANATFKGNNIIDSYGKPIKIITKDKIEWNGITYLRDEK